MDKKEREQNSSGSRLLETLFSAGNGLDQETAKGILRELPDWQGHEPVLYRDIRRFCDGVGRTEEAGRRLVIGAEHAGYRDHEGKPLCQWEPGILALTGRTGGKKQLHIYIPPDGAERKTGTDGQ